MKKIKIENSDQVLLVDNDIYIDYILLGRPQIIMEAHRKGLCFKMFKDGEKIGTVFQVFFAPYYYRIKQSDPFDFRRETFLEIKPYKIVTEKTDLQELLELKNKINQILDKGFCPSNSISLKEEELTEAAISRFGINKLGKYLYDKI